MQTSELRPCPCCEGKAKYYDDIMVYGHIVYCTNCGLKVTGYNSKEEAMEAWNRRPNPWHTGTPTENGTYVCRMKDDFAKWLVLNFKNGIWNVDGTSQSFADVGYNDCIEKWMKIAEEEET